MKVAVFSTKAYDREYLGPAFAESSHILTYFTESLNTKTANLAMGFDAVCVFVNDQVDKSVIVELAAGGTKLVLLRCAGYNNVDLTAANQSGMVVARVPEYSPHAAAEHAVALVLSLCRRTHLAYGRTTSGNFSLDGLLGFTLSGKTVGVVGTGKIGALFARIMLGFGCTVLAHDLYPSDALAATGVQYVPLTDLWRNSDIISLHCPLTPETMHLVNAETLGQMKSGVMIVNTARGSVIDTKDVMVALESGQVGYLGLDVYEHEEELFFQDLSSDELTDELMKSLLKHPNVLVTAHQGFFTHEALSTIAAVTRQNLNEFADGKPLQNVL